MIVLSIKIKVKPDKIKGFLQTVSFLLDEVSHEKGGISNHFFRDMDDLNAFVLLEEWESRRDLDRYLKSDIFGVLKTAQALRDRQALLKGGRCVIRFHLGKDVPGGLRRLVQAAA